MAEQDRPSPVWKRLPRWVYWTVGAAISCLGAITAKIIADPYPLTQRVPFWIAGTVIIFVGLWVLSHGTRARIEDEKKGGGASDQPR